MCKVLHVSRSSYYEYVKEKTHQPAIETGLADELRLIFQTLRRRYGSRRVGAELKERGYKAGRHAIRKLLKEQGLQAIQPRRRFAAAICTKDHAKQTWFISQP